jgi:hypothetical protein
MATITKEFTYNVTDDQYSQTNNNNSTATITYEGPDKKYIVVDRTTGKVTGRVIEESIWQDGEFNNQPDNDYAVEVDCNVNPLMCSLFPQYGRFDVEAMPTSSEDIPGSALPYVRNDPMLPDHVYEKEEIVYDFAAERFVEPFPWHPPIETWAEFLTTRNKALHNADHRLSEDMPTSLYNLVAKYKRYLRELPEHCGASWIITASAAGTGYSVGDGILISDPAFKNGASAADILLTVSEINDAGGIVKFTSSAKHCYDYHPLAGSYTGVYYTTNSAGSGATFNMSKIATVPPHKITMIRNPVESNDQRDGHSNALDSYPDAD